MGTNYYWRDRPCMCCKRYDEIHVGKSTGTWRAYPNKLVSEQHPEWGYSVKSPFVVPILTLENWHQVFALRQGELWTEYGERILDPLKWLSEMKPWTPGPEGRRYLDEEIRQGIGWIDPQGFKFYAEEFC